MSTSGRPKVLVLDPDADFLESIAKIGTERSVQVVTKLLMRESKVAIDELIISEIPDIMVINLDIEDESSFGTMISEVHGVPIPLPPIIVGTTNREGFSFRKKAYEAGVDDYLMRPFTAPDLWLRLDVLLRTRRLQKQLDDVSRKMSQLNLRLGDSNRRLEEMTLTDELTGLYNMRFMIQFLEKQFELLSRYARPFSIMMIDLDHFKSVNDKNDHLVGSSSIKAIGHVINETTRKSDIKARYGGDEYIVAMPETDIGAAKLAGERLRKAISEAKLLGLEEVEFKITASIGVATYRPEIHKSFTDLVKDADRAMYLAKENGRDRVEFLSKSVESYDETQSAVLTEIKKEIRSKKN